jgi:hypothetical protein
MRTLHRHKRTRTHTQRHRGTEAQHRYTFLIFIRLHWMAHSTKEALKGGFDRGEVDATRGKVAAFKRSARPTDSSIQTSVTHVTWHLCGAGNQKENHGAREETGEDGEGR